MARHPTITADHTSTVATIATQPDNNGSLPLEKGGQVGFDPTLRDGLPVTQEAVRPIGSAVAQHPTITADHTSTVATIATQPDNNGSLPLEKGGQEGFDPTLRDAPPVMQEAIQQTSDAVARHPSVTTDHTSTVAAIATQPDNNGSLPLEKGGQEGFDPTLRTPHIGG